MSVHVKEYQPGNDSAALGEGGIGWKDVYSALESSPGMEWYIVEEEGKSCVEYGCIEDSITRLKKMGK